MSLRVYIAGPMARLPLFNFPAFFEAEKDWAQAGWIVVNPARIDVEAGFDPAHDIGDTSEFYMHRDLPEVIGCDAIALLPGWRESPGTAKELTVARWCGLAVYDAVTMELLPDETILEEAQRLVFGPRQAAYGHPLTDFGRTGRMWGALLGLDRAVTAAEVAACMVALKLSREMHRPGRDNRVDAAGYVGTLELVRQAEGAA